MTSRDPLTLLDPQAAAVLRRLHAANDRQLPTLLLRLVPDLPALALGRPRRANPTAADDMGDAFLALGREQAAYCYAQARAVQARRVVEFGTSFGVSTIWLAAAVRDNGGGTVIGTEMVPAKAERARDHVREAGLADHVDIRVGNALETLRDLDGPVDLMLNDGFPDAALDVLRLVAPHLRPGAVVITDNVGVMRGDYADYVAWVRHPANGFVSVRLPYKGGTEVSVRVG
ncbi:class I SAM-dependent methyltransferase [Actinomycetospora endophytica]|uniref:Class I SAM-dependent methyltransferase n=1 Tax=Actinomycetospora endophytica TaxID=2291215 RepID=A0ABS8PI18_9PSEU|nr:class I SAM-dependent methyltransferase [Actinomycetospora endophytica]MCD2197903.1 class I SAM-dependent methyltransferase [Actinomycetospora endophytica]